MFVQAELVIAYHLTKMRLIFLFVVTPFAISAALRAMETAVRRRDLMESTPTWFPATVASTNTSSSMAGDGLQNTPSSSDTVEDGFPKEPEIIEIPLVFCILFVLWLIGCVCLCCFVAWVWPVCCGILMEFLD